jgi:polo-like kinase 4
MRNQLCNEITTGLKSPVVTGPTRRVVSDPIPRSTSSMVPERWIYPNLRSLSCPTSSSKVVNDRDTNSTCSRPDTPFLVTDRGSPEVTDTMRRQKPSAVGTFSDVFQLNIIERHTNPQEIPIPATSLPIGTMRPAQFNTLGLDSQTHKTAYGQVTILPSHALLVDFRESQRRKGFKGDEVIVIDSDGSLVWVYVILNILADVYVEISVYSAPHLSTPCCLVEPIQQFSVAKLPSTYWKQYNDAGRLINQIKQRTPKVISFDFESLNRS